MGNYLSYGTTLPTATELTIPPRSRRYGWKKDKPCDHDQFHDFPCKWTHSTVKKVDLREKCPIVYDQGQLGSCTANAIAGAYHFDEMKENETSPFVPSRLFIYYNERDMEGHVDEDSGAEIRDGIQSINTVGVCPESEWEYDISKFTEKPPAACYETAKNHHSVEYKRVQQSLSQLKACLAEGFPIVFGFLVYESFESAHVAQTGEMPMPSKSEECLGGHAVVAVGYDDDKKHFIIRNSWGYTWGDQGYFYMPYDYMTNSGLASDFWTVRKVIDS